MSKPEKQEDTGTKKPDNTIVQSSSNPHWGSSSPSSADTTNQVDRKASHCQYKSDKRPCMIDPGTVPSGKGECSKGSYKEALPEFNPAVHSYQTNTFYSIWQVDTRCNVSQFEEAMKGYEETHHLDPTDREVHYKLSCCHLSPGMLNKAEEHMDLESPKCQEVLSKKINELEDKTLLKKTKEVEDHPEKCINAAETTSDHSWKIALKEVESIIAAGTTSRLIVALKAEILLRLNRLDQAEETISKALKLEPEMQALVSLGMVSESYVCIIHAQVELALGRFENAVEAARQAHLLDPLNDEVTTIEAHVHMAKLARDKGDNMFHSGMYVEASEKYMIGLNYAWPNIVFLHNLATCYCQLGRWKKFIKFCDDVFKMCQNNPRAHHLCASAFAKLGIWAESAKDYEEQIALKASLGEGISEMKFEKGVEEVNSTEQYEDAISAPGPIIVFLMDPSKAECIEFSSFVESLCTSFPSANFLKVDINRCPLIVKSENVQVVPAFKIYKCRKNVKLMINPERRCLRFWVKIYTA